VPRRRASRAVLRLPRHPRPMSAFPRPPCAFPMHRVPRLLVPRAVPYARAMDCWSVRRSSGRSHPRGAAVGQSVTSRHARRILRGRCPFASSRRPSPPLRRARRHRHVSLRRGTRGSGRPHHRTMHSGPSLAPTRTTTASNRTPSPHPMPELRPLRMPPLGAAARSATGHLNSQLRFQSIPSQP
jgi:hypothetical protein